MTTGKPKVKICLMVCLTQDQNEGLIAPQELKFYGLCINWNSVKSLRENVVFIMLGSVYSRKSILEALNML